MRKTKRDTLSVIIIAKNEEEKIADCLKSVTWADEIVLVDNSSIDKTAEIAINCGVVLVNAPEELTLKYSKLRELGLEKAKSDWVLYLDADERISEELRAELLDLLDLSDEKQNKFYAIPRKNIVLGKELKYGGFGDFDKVKRLFIKKYLKGWVGDLHEEPELEKSVKEDNSMGVLNNKIIHLKAQTLSEMVEKTNKWSNVEAELMFKANHPKMNTLRFMSAMFREFWFRFVKHRAFLDGTVGVIHGLYQVYSRFLSYAKLWEMQLKIKNSKLKKSELI